jgi:hypothetical protein
MKKFKLTLMITCLCLCSNALGENDFGRFYTSPRQRLQLDELRSQRPQDDIEINVQTENFEDPDIVEETVNLVDSITVNGLVYRSDGKNTAWINSNSTIEGSIVNQYTRVNEQDVHANKVEITLPDNKSRIELKVGQQYDVHTQQVYDVGKDPINPNPVSVPGSTNQAR